MSDVGTNTSVTIINNLRNRVKKDNLKDAEEVKQALREEIQAIFDKTDKKLNLETKPSVILVVGVNGVGKTTSIGKIANRLRKDGKKVVVAAADTFRAAAVEQLEIWANRAGCEIVKREEGVDPASVVYDAIKITKEKNADVLICDTAGRLHIDDELMQELKNLKTNIKPHEILLVVDSMTGQDAVNIAQTFNETVGIDGVVLTKLDGDTRGGAALSVKKVTGKPIKFAATGEKLSDIEVFNPERMTSRILGMGDVLSIIEKAEEAISQEDAEKLEQQLRKNELDLDDYLAQIRQVKKMGSFSSILKMLPGMNKIKDLNIDDKEFDKVEAIICSMTKKEKRNPKILNGSRRLRIAKGSGTTVQDVNKFMKSFEMTQKMMKQMKSNKGGMRKMMKNIENMDPKDLKNFKI